MTPTKYKSALAKLGMTIVGAGPFFGLSRRQAQRVASGESPVPKLLVKVLNLLDEGKITKEDLQ